MNNFITLTKTFFLNGFKINKRKGNQKSTFKTLLLSSILFFGLSIYYNSITYNTYVKLGTPLEEFLIGFYAIATLLVLMISITGMQSAIFKTKDYEFLESLPVQKKTIVAAKIFSVYLISLAEDAIILLPTIAFYYIGTGNIYVTLLSFVFLFFASFVPIIFGSIFASLIAFLTNKLKHGNIIQIALYVLYFMGVFLVSFSVSGSQGDLDTGKLTKLVPYLKLLEKSFDINNFYYYIILILSIVVLSFLIILFISKIYRPINSYLSRENIHMEYIVTNRNERISQKKMLLKKEFKFLTGNALYLVNSFLGCVFYLMIGIMMNVINFAKETGASIEETQEVALVMMLCGMIMGFFMNSMMSSTTSSISLESNNFETLLSFPIDPKDIIKAKLYVGIIISCSLNIVVGLIVGIVSSILNGFNFIFFISYIIFPVLACILSAYIGLIMNLKHPKLEFDNLNQVLKNSSAVTISTFIGMGIALFMSGVVIVLNLIIGINLNYIPFLIVVLLYLILIGICYKYLDKNGTKLFRKVLSK